MQKLIMQKLTLSCAVLLAVAALSGCNNSKSPDAVANDVAAAQAKRAAEVADAKQDAAKDANKAEAKVDDKTIDLNNANAKGAYDVAMAQADGDHKVGLQKCDALSGDSQKACKNQADAKYDLAKANAKAMLAAQKP
jgi:Tfp pilus assembly major pilin PilA